MNDYLIVVSAQSEYQPDRSSAEERRYVFAYTVTIQNRGTKPARLIDRHWIITDAEGEVQEVHGQGVVGEQPRLRPGESYRYTSGAILKTPFGTMEGYYGMVGDDGTWFKAPIPPFSLRSAPLH